MIGGQVMDIESEGAAPTADLVETHPPRQNRRPHHHHHRLRRPLRPRRSARQKLVPHISTLRRADDTIARLRTFGEKAGLAFQIVDDILDMTQTSAELGKTAGKDTASDKATWPAVFGIEQSRRDADALIADAFAALDPFGSAADPLKSLAHYLTTRTH